MTDLIRAPWTPEQVAALNEYQRRGGRPFTCGADHAGPSPALFALPDGWHCWLPDCDYRQDWAYAFMADPTAGNASPPSSADTGGHQVTDPHAPGEAHGCPEQCPVHNPGGPDVPRDAVWGTWAPPPADADFLLALEGAFGQAADVVMQALEPLIDRLRAPDGAAFSPPSGKSLASGHDRTDICEIPHPTVAEEDECERRRLAAADADPDDGLRRQLAAAIRDGVRVRLGTYALDLAERGMPVQLNHSEADAAADAVLPVIARHIRELRADIARYEAAVDELNGLNTSFQRDVAHAERHMREWRWRAADAERRVSLQRARAERAEADRDQLAGVLAEVRECVETTDDDGPRTRENVLRLLHHTTTAPGLRAYLGPAPDDAAYDADAQVCGNPASDTAPVCGLPHHQYPARCAEPPRHPGGVHAGPLIVNGRLIGSAAWSEQPLPWAETIDSEDDGRTIRIPGTACDGSHAGGVTITREQAPVLAAMLHDVADSDEEEAP